MIERHLGGGSGGGSDVWYYKKIGETYYELIHRNNGEKRLQFKIDRFGDRIVYLRGKAELIHYRKEEDAENFKRGQWNIR